LGAGFERVSSRGTRHAEDPKARQEPEVMPNTARADSTRWNGEDAYVVECEASPTVLQHEGFVAEQFPPWNRPRSPVRRPE